MKEKKNNQHVYGVFLRILKKGKDNTRIFIMELSSGKFKNGLIPTEIIRKVKLRQIISVDLTDIHEVKDINKIVSSKYYNIQPSVYPNDIDENLLG